MYQPPHHREARLAVQHELIRAHPLGLLITAGPGGLLANPVPFLIDSERGEYGTLRAHVARANPQWRELGSVDECLVVFQGPQEYITPSWYATKRETGKIVPTWNYATVHGWGEPDALAGIRARRAVACRRCAGGFCGDANPCHRRHRNSDRAYRG